MATQAELIAALRRADAAGDAAGARAIAQIIQRQQSAPAPTGHSAQPATPAAPPDAVGDHDQRIGAQVRNLTGTLADIKANPRRLTNAPRALGAVADFGSNVFGTPAASVVDAFTGPVVRGVNNAFGTNYDPHKVTDSIVNAAGFLVGASETRAALKGATEALPRSVTNLSPIEQSAATKLAARAKLQPIAMVARGVRYESAGIKPTVIDTSGSSGQSIIRAVASKTGGARAQVEGFAQRRAVNLGGRLANQAETARPLAPVTTPDIPGQVASTGDAMGPRNGSQMVHTALNDARDAAQAKVTAAYDTARAADPAAAMIPNDQKPVIASNLREAVRDYDPRNIPQVSNELSTVDGLSTIQARDLFDLRARLTNLRQSADPVTAGAAGKAVRAVDAEIDRVQPMMTGDPSVVQSWRDAIAARREFGQKFEGGDLIDTLTDRTNRGGANVNTVAPEDASSAIFGRSQMGFAGKPNLTRDLARVSDTLGADHPAVQGLQREAFDRLVEASTKGGKLDAAALRDNLAKLGPMGDTLLPGWKRMSVGDLADLAARPDAVQIGGGVLTKTPSQMSQLTAGLTPAEQVNAQHGAVNELQFVAGKGPGRTPGLARDVSMGDNVGENLTRIFGNETAADLQSRFGLEGETLTNARNANPRDGSPTNLNQQGSAEANLSNAMDVTAGALRAKSTMGLSLPFDLAKLYLKNRGFNDAEAEALGNLVTDPSRTADVHRFIEAKAGTKTANGFLSMVGNAPNAFAKIPGASYAAPGLVTTANAFGQQPAQMSVGP